MAIALVGKRMRLGNIVSGFFNPGGVAVNSQGRKPLDLVSVRYETPEG